MKRFITFMVTMVILFVMVCPVYAAERVDMAKAVSDYSLEILRSLKQLYDIVGDLGDDYVYLATVYFKLYLASMDVYSIEDEMEIGHVTTISKTTVSMSISLENTIDQKFQEWMENKNDEYEDMLMRTIGKFI